MRNALFPPKTWVLVCNGLLITVLAMNVYRACTQCITVDEAFSYFSFISVPFNDMFKRYDANNHVLNTLLSKAITPIFGVSEFTLRIPALLGGALFLLASQRFLLLILPDGCLAFLTYCAVALNPIVLDYLSAARGYSLALGFQFSALWLLAMEKKPARDWLIGTCLGLSVASNLTFIVPNALIVGVWFGLTYRKEEHSLTRALRMTAALAVTAALFLALPLANARSANFYVGHDTAAESLSILLSRSFGFPDFLFGHGTSEVLIRIAPVVLLAASIVAIGALIAGRQSTFLVPLVFVGSIASLVALHVLFHVPYPHERTGLYLIPLATITLALSLQLWLDTGKALAVGRIWGALVCLFLIAAVLQYSIELKVDRYEEWTFDAGTKRVLLTLKAIRAGQSHPEHLGVTWILDQTVNWYRVTQHWTWLQPVSRADPRTNSFDSYYLTQEDFDVIKLKDLKVVYTDPVSGSVLALP